MSPPATEQGSATSSPPRVVLAGKTGRILCVADIRGDYHELNRLIREHEATAVIHTGDFGFMNADSLDRMGDKILRHLLQYSPLIANGTRQSLLAIPTTSGRQALIEALNNSSIHFPLSQFPHLISGAITFPVPVFTVWGLIEDVRVLEKFRSGEYEVHNLNIIDEATSRVLDVGGLRLRLFGLGGAVAPHKMFDNGEGKGTIAGGQGTMWTTTLQLGELVDTALRNHDPTETRLFISSAPISRNGILSQLSAAIKADLTVSGGLHFRYPASFNDFSVHADFESYRQKLAQSRDVYMGIYSSVKEKVEPSLNEAQIALLKKALGVMQTVPEVDDGSWTNTWHWVLSDASCGHLLFAINDGRVSAETHSQGLNFSHRAGKTAAPPSAPKLLSNPLATPVARTATSAAPSASAQAAVPVANPSIRPPPSSNATAPNVMRPANGPLVRPPGVTATPSARPPLGQQASSGPQVVRPSFNGPNGPAVNGPGMNQMRPGMLARPPLGGAVKSGNAFGTPPAGLARPPQAPRGVRGVSGSGSTTAPALPAASRAEDGARPATINRPGPNATSSANNSASNVNAKPGQTVASTTANGQEKRENRFAPLANVREPREPREPREAKGKDVKEKEKAGVNGTTDKGKKTDKKEDDKAKDATPTGAAAKGNTDKPEKTDKMEKSKDDKPAREAKDGKSTLAPASAAAAADGKKEDAKDVKKDDNAVNASAPASGAATPAAGSDDVKAPVAPPKKPGLFINRVPAGTGEEDLKGMFGGDIKDKIVSARVVKGKYSKPDFAYIDFSTEDEAIKALAECTKKIKDTDVVVVISNPPIRQPASGGRGGRGGASGGRGRGGMRPPRSASGVGKEGGEKPAAAPAPAAAAK